MDSSMDFNNELDDYTNQLHQDIKNIIKKVKLSDDKDGLNVDEQLDDLTTTLTHNKIVCEPKLGQNDCYVVDDLLDCRVNKKGKKEYLVSWENEDFEPNWEPEENINSSLIRKFHINQEVKQHNKKMKRSKGKAHLYLRVSDSSKTSSLFKQSQPTQSTQQSQPQPQSQQSYFGDFPAGNFSLESQKEMLMKYCVDNQLLISSIEMDDGISARNLSKLVGLQKIIENIKPYETLLVLDLSRFARHTLGGLQILENLSSQNIHIHSILDDMTYDTPASRHCVRTTISCAEMESDIKSAKLKASIQNIKNMGGFVGSRAPFGYKVIRDGALRKLVTHDNEQKIMQIISDVVKAKGNTPYIKKLIASQLNESGFTMRGKFFTMSNVQYIIKKYLCNSSSMDTRTTTYGRIITKRKSDEDLSDNQNKKRKDDENKKRKL